MKNRLIKYYIAAFCFCSTSILFAQPGTEDTGGTGNLEGTTGDTTPAPIDDYVGVLALVGLSLVFIKVKVNQNKENAQLNK
jgi:hypothetical protein